MSGSMRSRMPVTQWLSVSVSLSVSLLLLASQPSLVHANTTNRIHVLPADEQPNTISTDAMFTPSTPYDRALVASNCTIVADLATPVSLSAMQCFANSGIQMVVVRVFQSNCYLDPHAVDSIHAAWNAGLAVDVYFFPSYGCDMDQKMQVDVALNHLQQNNALFNRFWIDVEAWEWEENCETNVEWLTPLIAYSAQQLSPARVGIYAGHNFFVNSMCNTTAFSALGIQLWYARWDHNASFYNYSSFGGFDTPFMKQYNADGLCDIRSDSDWRESGDCGSDLRIEWEKQHPVPVTPITPPATPVFPPAPSKREGSNCTKGVDLATPVSVNAFQCLIQNHGVQYLVVRSFQSNCYIDPHTVGTIHAAWAAGISGVDVYFFPSVGCDLDAISQFDTTMTHLANNNATFNRLYFDVEDWSWAPESSCQENIDWFSPLIAHAQQVLGVDRVGIYTLKTMWNRITCNSLLFNSSRLWYASWDEKPTFDGFVPFGGWTQPDLKQFSGNDFACDIHLDFDYRQSGQC